MVGHTPAQFNGDIIINNVSFYYPSRPDVKVKCCQIMCMHPLASPTLGTG